MLAYALLPAEIIVDLARSKEGLENENRVICAKLQEAQRQLVLAVKDREQVQQTAQIYQEQLALKVHALVDLLRQVVATQNELAASALRVDEDASASPNLGKAHQAYSSSHTAIIYVGCKGEGAEEALQHAPSAQFAKACTTQDEQPPGPQSLEHQLAAAMAQLSKTGTSCVGILESLRMQLASTEEERNEAQLQALALDKRLEQAKAAASSQREATSTRCSALEEENELLAALSTDAQQKLLIMQESIVQARQQLSEANLLNVQLRDELEAQEARADGNAMALEVLQASLAAAQEAARIQEVQLEQVGSVHRRACKRAVDANE